MEDAIRSKDRAKVEALIAEGEDVNKVYDTGNTALTLASRLGDIDIVKLLLEKGADVNLQNEDGNTPLIAATESGSTAILSLLLEKGADPDIQDTSGATALIWTTMYDSAELAQLLLDEGADPDIPDENGDTALIVASRYGHTNIVKLLLEKGASLDIQNADGNTALDVAEDEIRTLLGAPVVVAKEPKEVEYTDEPMCFDMLMNEDISVLQALTSGKTVFKIENAYNSTETGTLLEQLEKNESLRYKCKQESVELRTLRPEDVEMNKPYYLLTIVGNYMVDLKELTAALRSGYRVFELIEAGEEVEFTASRDSLYDDATGKNLLGEELNYVGADHCQKGTNRKPYSLQPLSFVKKKAGGKRKTYRKKPSTRRRKTYRK